VNREPKGSWCAPRAAHIFAAMSTIVTSPGPSDTLRIRRGFGEHFVWGSGALTAGILVANASLAAGIALTTLVLAVGALGAWRHRTVVVADAKQLTYTGTLGIMRRFAAGDIADAVAVTVGESSSRTAVRLTLRGGRTFDFDLRNEGTAQRCAEWILDTMLGERPRAELLSGRHDGEAKIAEWLRRARIEPADRRGTGLLAQPVVAFVGRRGSHDELDLLDRDGHGIGTLLHADAWQLRHLGDEWALTCETTAADAPVVRRPDGTLLATLDEPFSGGWRRRSVLSQGEVVGSLERAPYLVRVLDDRVHPRDIDVYDTRGTHVAQIRGTGVPSVVVLHCEDGVSDALRGMAMFLAALER
jgi:hypothetical protein